MLNLANKNGYKFAKLANRIQFLASSVLTLNMEKEITKIMIFLCFNCCQHSENGSSHHFRNHTVRGHPCYVG